MGNGDCDFGARPTKHTAIVMCCKFYLVLHITYLAMPMLASLIGKSQMNGMDPCAFNEIL